MNKCVSEFSLTHRAGEVPTLSLNLLVADGMEIELPHGLVVATQETTEQS